MAYNPNSLKNLEKGTKFTPGDSRIQSGKVAGTRNMKTVLLDWLYVQSDCTDPIGNEVQLPLIDKVALAIISKACQGNVSAVNFVSNCAFGKMNEPAGPQQEGPQESPLDWDVYTREEMQQLIDLLNKGAKNKKEDWSK